MVTFFTGTPGSGKSYHATERIYVWLRQGRKVISTYPVNLPKNIKKFEANLTVVQTLSLDVKFLLDYYKENLDPNHEDQCLVIIDEAHILFNPRDYAAWDRKQWLLFFPLHRHFGFDFIIVTQNDRQIDRQIRAQCEIETRHRKLSNFGLKGLFLSLLFHKKFMSIDYWYPLGEKSGTHM